MFNRRIFVAGHKGMVGSAICRKFACDSSITILTADRDELDLLCQNAVKNYFKEQKPDAVILAAAKVGGIKANADYPAEFIYENLQIQNNIIHESHIADIQTLLFLGSSCIYPKYAEQPIDEGALLMGKLEHTNEPYAVAKIAGIKMCESYNRQYGRDYRSIMPTNLYGPGDNFHPQNSHVLPALLRRFHEAKINGESSVSVWGSGSPRREFLHVDDMAHATKFIMSIPAQMFKEKVMPMQSHVNVGSGYDISIRELSELIRQVVGFKGEIHFDLSKPDGTPRKLMSVKLLKSLGWVPNIGFEEGLRKTYRWYIQNEPVLRSK